MKWASPVKSTRSYALISQVSFMEASQNFTIIWSCSKVSQLGSVRILLFTARLLNLLPIIRAVNEIFGFIQNLMKRRNCSRLGVNLFYLAGSCCEIISQTIVECFNRNVTLTMSFCFRWPRNFFPKLHIFWKTLKDLGKLAQ